MRMSKGGEIVSQDGKKQDLNIDLKRVKFVARFNVGHEPTIQNSSILGSFDVEGSGLVNDCQDNSETRTGINLVNYFDL